VSASAADSVVYAANCATLAEALTGAHADANVLGGVEHIGVALAWAGGTAHAQHPGAACWSLALLDVLLASGDTQPTCSPLVAAAMMRTAVALLREHEGNGEVLDAAARVVQRCVTALGPAPGSAAAAVEGAANVVVNSMSAAADDARLQARACALLVLLAGAGETVRRDAAAAGAPNAAMACVAAFPGDVDVQTHGLACLAAYMTTPTAASSASSEDALGAALAALHAHGAEAAVMTSACDTLSALCRLAPGAAQALHAKEGASVLTAACQAHTGDADAVATTAAATALSSLCAGCPAACASAVACGAIGALCDALFVHTKQAALCNAACGALARLCTASQAASLLRKAGGVHAAVAVLRQHVGAPAVVCRSASLIARATLAGLGKEALAGGAPAALTEALAQHPGHAGVTQCVCLAVTALLAQPRGTGGAASGNASPAAAELVARGCVPALVRVLGAARALPAPAAADASSQPPATAAVNALHRLASLSPFAASQAVQSGGLAALAHIGSTVAPRDAGACQAVCACIACIASDASANHAASEASMHSAGAALEVALATLTRHGAAHPEVAAAACSALAALATGRTTLARRAVSAGAVQLVCSCLARQGVTQAATATAAATALQALTTGDTAAKEAAADVGAIAATVTCLRTHDTVPTVAASCAGALGSLAVSEVNQGLAAQHGAIEAVVAALIAHGACDSRCATQCCVALTNLAANAANEARAVTAGATSAVLKHALQAHPGDARVVEEACAALANLSFTPAHADTAKQLGVPAAVRAAKERHAGIASVVSQADYVLEALASTS
jgi:hypothetical protein